MKGTSFQNGIEYKVVIEGENWSQGDTISGKLEAIARNASAKPSCYVALAEGSERRIKAKSAEAFSVAEKSESASTPLAWKFTLPLDARITDKAGSLYLLYGGSAETPVPGTPSAIGNLKLNILPHLHLRDLIEVMNSHFRFVPKSTTAGKKGTVDVKFDPPSAKEWTQTEALTLSLKLTETDIEADFQFVRGEIDASKPGLISKSTKRDLTRVFPLADIIHDFNQRLNKDAAIGAIENVVAEYRDTGWRS